MAGKVGQVQAIARLKEEVTSWGFSIQDRRGAPLLTFTFETVEEANAYRHQVETIVQSAESLVDMNGRAHE